MTQGRLDLGSTTCLTRWSPADWPVAPDWQALLHEFWASESAHRLGEFIRSRLAAGARIYPPDPLRALALTPRAQVRVLILGQDPYHGLGQAQGLAFSVPPGTAPPPSLRNIFKELTRDPDLPRIVRTASGSLAHWASQGVLMLNTCLSVEEGKPASHANQGWEVLTDMIIQALWDDDGPRVYMLWGAHAQKKMAVLGKPQRPGQLVLQANHPSPLSARRGPHPFLGCGHFSQANAFLRQHGQAEILW